MLRSYIGEISDGQPIFPGESEVDQLYIIQKVIGPLIPDHLDLFLQVSTFSINSMRIYVRVFMNMQLIIAQNPRFAGLKFPDMSRPETLQKKYMGRLAKTALLFMKSLLCMDPELRPNTLASLNHSYFEDLNQQQHLMQQQQIEAKRERQQQHPTQSTPSQFLAAPHNAPVPIPSPRSMSNKSNTNRVNNVNSNNSNQLPVTAESKAGLSSNQHINRENINSMNQSKMNPNLMGKKPNSRDNTPVNGGLGITDLKRQYSNGMSYIIMFT